MMKHFRPHSPPEAGRRASDQSPMASGAACYLVGCGIVAIVAPLPIVRLDQELLDAVLPRPLNRFGFGFFE